ncbi:MAG: TIGR03936 family radical SAM-associated protein [Isosphaeraceae bacterium]|nr:TIGR03936 family radical SAM-associated protein [Isosphaeraceae bacterium]
MTAHKVRLHFGKRGDLRLVSHHDLLRCLERLLRRAEVPMAHSQGFNPRPKIVFAQALGLGIEGLREVVELELTEPVSCEELLRRLRAASPPGLDWLECNSVPPGRAARVLAAEYCMMIPVARRHEASLALDRLSESTHWPYTRHRPDRTSEFDLRPFLLAAALDAGGVLSFRMKIEPSGSARPEEVIDALGLRDLLGEGAVLVRRGVELAP